MKTHCLLLAILVLLVTTIVWSDSALFVSDAIQFRGSTQVGTGVVSTTGWEDRVAVTRNQAGLTPIQQAILQVAKLGVHLWDDSGNPVEVSLAGGGGFLGTNEPTYDLPRVLPSIAKIEIHDGAQTTDETLAVLRAFP